MDDLDMQRECYVAWKYIGIRQDLACGTKGPYPTMRRALKVYQDDLPNKGHLLYARVIDEQGRTIRNII